MIHKRQFDDASRLVNLLYLAQFPKHRLALAVQPSLRPARLELGKLLLNTGRSREAIPALLPALEINDSYTPLFLMFMAHACASTGDLNIARDHLKQAHARVLKTGPLSLQEQTEHGLQRLGPAGP